MANSMKVSEAIMSRISVRDFIPNKQPPLSLIMEILERARQNIESEHIEWKVYVLEGSKLSIFVKGIQNKLNKGSFGTEHEYNVYPLNLKLKYHKRRKKLAVMMYKLLDIAYKDKFKRFQHLKKNWSFFNAPIALIFTMNNATKDLIQFFYLGMFMQNVMLLLQERGIDSCAQEAWAAFSKTAKELLHIDKKELLFCGMCIGYKNAAAKVNTLRSEREKLEHFATFHSKL